MTVRSTALLNEPETSPQLEADRRIHALANRGGAPVQSASVPATGTAVELTTGLTERQHVFIKNSSSANVYIGGAGVDTSNGYLLRPKEELWLDLTASAAIYGRTSGTTADVRVLETGG